MPSSLFPAFIKLEYHSAYAPHIALWPTRGIDIDEGNPIASTIADWGAGQVLWTDMVDDLVAALADLAPTTVNFDRATLFNVTGIADDPQPISTYVVDVPGTEAAPGYTQAVQLTMIWRTTDFNISKLVLLDGASFDAFDKVISLTGQPALTAINDVWTSVANGFAGRDNARPDTFVAATKTLNEKLRRSYRQA